MRLCTEEREVLRLSILCAPAPALHQEYWRLLTPKEPSAPPCRHELAPAKERPATALLHSRRATQNHPNGRILDQYALRRLTACLVDLTSIPDGQRIKSWCPDWADFHFLRDPRSRDPYIHVTVANLVALWVGECFCCRDGQYQ